MQNLLISLNCVVPFFVYLMAGYYARRRGFIPEETYPRINVLCYHVLMPLVIFRNMYTLDVGTELPVRLVAFVMAGTVALFLLGSFLSKCQAKEEALRNVYRQNAFRGNIGIISLALAEKLMKGDELVRLTIVVAVSVIVYNILAVIAFETGSDRNAGVKKALKGIATNPIILGVVVGALLPLLGIRLPEAVMSAVTAMSNTAVVLSLLVLGARCRFERTSGGRRRIAMGVVTRLLLCPALFTGAGFLLGFRGADLATVYLLSAAPLSINSYTMCQVYHADTETAGQIVVITSFASCLTYFVGIFLLKQLGII